MEFVKSQPFWCPYCDASIEMQLELLYGEQEYIEDCEVCCQPIKIHYMVDQCFQLLQFDVSREDEC